MVEYTKAWMEIFVDAQLRLTLNSTYKAVSSKLIRPYRAPGHKLTQLLPRCLGQELIWMRAHASDSPGALNQTLRCSAASVACQLSLLFPQIQGPFASTRLAPKPLAGAFSQRSWWYLRGCALKRLVGLAPAGWGDRQPWIAQSFMENQAWLHQNT